MRPFEQVRDDICEHNLDITLAGPGAGFSYSHNGPTHYGLEDISIMRSLPNMTVVCPGDPVEVEAAVLASLKHKGPMYIRLGKAGEPVLHKNKIRFQIGKAITMMPGKQVTVIATSNLLQNAVEAGKLLKQQGIHARVISMHTIKPLDVKVILKAARETKVIITVEEHSIIGGLGSAVAEVLADNHLAVKFKRLGVPDTYPKVIGSQAFYRDMYGLSPAKIVIETKKLIKRK
jgi:transketolase